jgi:hypothetical protein
MKWRLERRTQLLRYVHSWISNCVTCFSFTNFIIDVVCKVLNMPYFILKLKYVVCSNIVKVAFVGFECECVCVRACVFVFLSGLYLWRLKLRMLRNNYLVTSESTKFNLNITMGLNIIRSLNRIFLCFHKKKTINFNNITTTFVSLDNSHISRVCN